jgi:F-type H+-transporting ATPase subunit a
MASPILHIKDSFYFEVPKSLWPVKFGSAEDFVGAYEVWLRLDPDFQAWEAEHFYEKYAALKANPRAKEELLHKYSEWKHHDHAHAGKPFWRFIAEEHDRAWYESQLKSSPSFQSQWRSAIEATSGSKALAEYRLQHANDPAWSQTKLDAYSRHLSGKILIPQPFGRLRNLHEKEWGLCISRFMLIEVAVALVLWAVFSWLGQRVARGDRPQGALWNLLEAMVTFIRDEIARPVIGHEDPKPHVAVAGGHGHGDVHLHGAHEDAAHATSAHVTSAHDNASAHPTTADPLGESKEESSEHDAHHHHDPEYDADRFAPLLLTIFFFILGCNLSGMLPWVGAPTGEWGTTSAIAMVTFATGVIFGMKRFGVFGYFKNQVPAMDLPLVMAIILKPLVFLIELMGLLIKHSILSIRLLANMVAGHIVLLSIMALAFSVEGVSSSAWPLTAVISIVGSTLLSCLELFVAFLQAYVFTFLSAMFIGAAIHEH